MDPVLFIENIKNNPIKTCGKLNEFEMWSEHRNIIWMADRFEGSPAFYPVYQYKNYYSYSPLALIILKGNLCKNRRAIRASSIPNFLYYSGMDTIDKEIVRIGGPPKSNFKIKRPHEYANKLASAMIKDISEIEIANNGYTNIILCGGKDSLNLTLLPWKNPVIIASADPNYEHVKEFLEGNDLKYDLFRLNDSNKSLVECEILANCCRNNLEHCRWGYDLRQLSHQLGRKIIFWKGQMGDTFMTPYWKNYSHPPDVYDKYSSNLFKIFNGRGRHFLKKYIDHIGLTQRLFFWSYWYRGAMWQGSHMSIIRNLADALVLSGYHGPEVQKVISEVDLRYAVKEDVRPIVGKILHDSEVVYPSANPSPPKSEIRKNISNFKPFADSLVKVGIPVKS